MDRLEEIREREQAATPGSWNIDRDGQIRSGIILVAGCNPIIRNGELWSDGIRYPNSSNAEFIAHTREDIPYLLSEIDHLKDIEQKRDAYWGNVINSVQELVMEKEGEIDRLTARVEALEGAIRAFESSTGMFSFACFCCVYKDANDSDKCDLLGYEVCEDMENWEFDYERFAGGERE